MEVLRNSQRQCPQRSGSSNVLVHLRSAPRHTCKAGEGSGLFGGLSKLFGGSPSAQTATSESSAPSTSKPSSNAGSTSAAANNSLLDNMLRGATAGDATPDYPPYQVIARTKDYILRLYDVFPIVEMEYQRREEAYATLGGYFDGENATGQQFAYTQPVVMRYEPSGRKRMQMLVASKRGEQKAGEAAKLSSPSELPLPTSSAVTLSVSGGELVAVYQFDGYITPKSAEAARKQLMAALQRDGLKLADEEAAGLFRCAQYGAVYQLGGRLNELMLRVKA